jgi:hypothetical protein
LEKRKNQASFSSSASQGLHNKPQGCGASVASAAGPSTIKKGLHLLLVLNTVIMFKFLFSPITEQP